MTEVEDSRDALVRRNARLQADLANCRNEVKLSHDWRQKY